MVILSFRHSKSKRYKEAIALVNEFKETTIDANGIVVQFTYIDIFERWESFNLLFWIVVDWKDTWLMWDKYKFYSHRDKVRVFYGIQTCHSKFMWHVNDLMKSLPIIAYMDEVGLDTKILGLNADKLIDKYNNIRQYISEEEIKKFVNRNKKDS